MLLFRLTLLAALAATPALAQQLSTVIVTATAPPQASLAIAADEQSRPTATVDLQFQLAPLSGEIGLSRCALRVVLDQDSSRSDDNGVMLQLVDTADSRLIAAQRVPPRTAAGSAVLLRSKSLCATLEQALKPEGVDSGAVRLRLQTITRNGALSLAGSATVAGGPPPGRAPRLLLGRDAVPDVADWGQIRQGAGHGGRSEWRLYDPQGSFGVTASAVLPITVNKVSTDLRQSPILDRDRILVVTDLDAGQFRLAALDRSGAILTQVALKDPPRFLAAGGAGRLAYASENRILLFDPRALATAPVALPIPAGETLRDPPTLGRDGALYTVTAQHIRGFSPGLAESWRFAIGKQDDLAAVALSADAATAYVLIAGSSPALLALDAGSGDCRWRQPLPPILHGNNEPMPVPVVIGADILVTQAFPTGDQIYVIHDRPPDAGPSDRGGIAPPVPQAACQADAAPAGLSRIGAPGDHIPTPMAGIGNDAFYLRAGSLCRGRSAADPANPDSGPRRWREQCAPLQGCALADTQAITLLIGDSSGGESVDHLYALAAEARQLFFISAHPQAEGGLAPTCRMQPVARLGPNLVLGADGTLVNVTLDRGLQAIVPSGFAPGAGAIILTQDLLAKNNRSSFRTPAAISTAADLRLGPGAEVILVAGERIVFSTGLRISAGAGLRARVGF